MDMTRQLAMPKVLYAHIADVQKKITHKHTQTHKRTKSGTECLAKLKMR